MTSKERAINRHMNNYSLDGLVSTCHAFFWISTGRKEIGIIGTGNLNSNMKRFKLEFALQLGDHTKQHKMRELKALGTFRTLLAGTWTPFSCKVPIGGVFKCPQINFYMVKIDTRYNQIPTYVRTVLKMQIELLFFS